MPPKKPTKKPTAAPKKAAPAAPKKAAPKKKPAPAPKKKVAEPAPKKKVAAAPVKKATPPKKVAPVKKAAPAKKAAPTKKPVAKIAKPAAKPSAKKPPAKKAKAPVEQASLPLEPVEPKVAPLTGEPMLPRDRDAGPTRRTPVEAKPVAEAKPAVETKPAVEPKPETVAPPPPRTDPLWGALTSRPPTQAQLDAAAFWSGPGLPPRPERPPQGTDGPSQQAQGQPGVPGQGRRRRRRRRGGGGGGGMERGPSEPGPGREPFDTSPADPLLRRLRRQFNLRDFRAGQEQVIRDLLSGRDVLALMPTGAGKSLTYQLTAFELPGVTVVVSPLLALMSDQLAKLRRTGAVGARLDSTETAKEKRATIDRIDKGSHKIIYCTPERAASGALNAELGSQKVGLFVVDEAHCVSEWGHDFRPAYLSLKQCINGLPSAYLDRRPPVLALTATATPQVADDIIHQLQLKDPDRIHTGFNRPSLTFDVRFANDLKQQVRRLIRLIRRIKGPGIVYCSTVRDTEALFGALPKLGIKVGIYNGKMPTKEREESQRQFMRNQPRIMVATNAFGLGVDKPDIRFVIHWNIPGSIESYYQEAGRAGRDGKPSRCILLYNPNDESVQEFFLGGKYPSKSEMKQVIFAVTTREGTLKEIAMNAGTSQAKARVTLNALRDRGLVEEMPGPTFRLVGEQPDELTIGRAAEEYRKRREADRNKLEWMIRYARSTKCRMRIFLEYFGEKELPLCGRCDNCKKYGAEADRERTVDLMSPVEIEESEEDRDADPEPYFPELPAPPRKDTTTMF